MDNLAPIADALAQQRYTKAAKLLKPLLKHHGADPQVQLYVGNVHEGMGKLEKAEAVYCKLLRSAPNPKIVRAARQGLDRLEQAMAAQRQSAIAQASNDPLNDGTGFLLIAPVDSQARPSAARAFAKIMGLDPYTANMQLPSRTWKVWRTGAMPALAVYRQDLAKAGLTTFVLSLKQLKTVQVFQALYVKAMADHITVVCQNSDGQKGELSFRWQEVTHFVDGLLPIFEQVVDLGAYNKLQRKEKTQDYAQVHDLHLTQRRCILRFCDRVYQFGDGVSFNGLEHPELPAVYATTRLKWNALTQQLKENVVTASGWIDFTTFGQTALDHLDLVDGFEPHISFFRKAETKWDHAFQLYSGAAFWQFLDALSAQPVK